MQGPTRYIVRIMVFLAAVAGLAFVLFPTLQQAFFNNPVLNGVILAALAIGILFILRHTVQLGPEVEWMRTIDEEGPTRALPNLLRPVATMAKGREGPPSLPPVTLRSVLDGVAARLDESRELSRYLISLLIFLGLLGTFWGLIKTVGSVSHVIDTLDFNGTNAAQGLSNLKSGLLAPLSGMGTAFSASLFGLAGSLILGFLDLQLGQAQNAFFRNLEDWLSGAHKPVGMPFLDADVGSTHYVQALVEQTAENLDQLRQSVVAAQEAQRQTGQHLAALVERLGPLTSELREGRLQMTQELRNDLKLIARTLGHTDS